MDFFSVPHLMLILLIVVLVFGAGKLPRVMGDFAKGIKAFKAGMHDNDEGEAGPSPAQVTPPIATSAPAAADRPHERV